MEGPILLAVVELVAGAVEAGVVGMGSPMTQGGLACRLTQLVNSPPTQFYIIIIFVLLNMLY